MTNLKITTLATAIAMALPAYAQQADPANETADTEVSPTAVEMKQAETKKDDTEVITVQGVHLADLKARAIERDRNSFSSVIATDDLGNFVDQNVAESLRRMPGVTLERSEGEGKYVAVRGLGAKFVSVSMNGAELSGAGDERKIGLDGITGDSLGVIEVFKTLTPEHNLNSIGGAVNVKAISAFDTGKESLKLKVQNSYSELRKKHSPKFSISGTDLSFDEKLGIGFALSHENRKTQVDENRHHSTREMNFLSGGIGLNEEELLNAAEILIPAQLENRREIADRTRTNATLNVEFKSDENNFYYLRANFSRFTDDDIALREYYNFYNGDLADEVIYVNADTKEFVLSDIDVMNQHFIQEDTTDTLNFSIGAEHLIGEDWTFDYEYAQSKTDNESVGDRRVQFRERENIVYGQAGREEIVARVITKEQAAALGGFELDPNSDVFNGETDGDISDLSNMQYDNLFMEDSTRVDEIKSIKANLRKDFDLDYMSYIKTGFTYNERTHDRNKDRWSYAPKVEHCGDDQACITAVTSNVTDYPNNIPSDSDFSYPILTKQAVEDLVDTTQFTREAATGGGSSIDSTKGDYYLEEDTYAAYVMGEFLLADDLSIITGVRYSHTKFSSTGFMSLKTDKWSFDGSHTLDIAVPLPESEITYSEFYPSFHVRYEPQDDLLIRGAIWTSYTRPSFKQARGFADFKDRISLCDPTTETLTCYGAQEDQSAIEIQGYVLGSDNVLQVGNPNLVPMTSTNFDASVGWYPKPELFMEIAFFYKDIDNFIVDVSGIQRGIDELPLTLPVNQVAEFSIPQDLVLNQVDITLNGEKAKVYGIELSYNQFFENGFFIQSNMTFVDSEAELDKTVRQGKMQLPNQADVTANISLGWEKDDFSARVIANYRSEILDQIGSCPTELDGIAVNMNDAHSCKTWSDIYQDDITTIDFKVKYDVSDSLSLYFDAINLTEQSDLRYFEGNELSGGNILFQREFYGSTYQVGMNYTFY